MPASMNDPAHCARTQVSGNAFAYKSGKCLLRRLAHVTWLRRAGVRFLLRVQRRTNRMYIGFDLPRVRSRMSQLTPKRGLLHAIENRVYRNECSRFTGSGRDGATRGGSAGYGRLFTCYAGATERGAWRPDGRRSAHNSDVRENVHLDTLRWSHEDTQSCHIESRVGGRLSSWEESDGTDEAKEHDVHAGQRDRR